MPPMGAVSRRITTWKRFLCSQGVAVNVKYKMIWGFPKIRGSFLGVPIIRVIVF